MRSQLLAGPRPRTLANAVARVGALQAQSTSAVRMAVRARTEGLTQADFDDAVATSRTAVRTWLMRGTSHVVTVEDVGWMVDLIGPIVRAKYRRRRDQFGLTDELCDRALDTLPEILSGKGPLPLRQVMTALADRDVHIDTSDQAPTHLMLLAATHGLVCRGPEAGRLPTFALTGGWLTRGPRLDRDESLIRLARMYMASRGAAAVADFGTCRRCRQPMCRRGFELLASELVQVDAAGTPLVALADTDLTPPPTTPARRIGMWDEYLLSHRHRNLILDPAVADRILVGGVIQAALVGQWTRGGILAPSGRRPSSPTLRRSVRQTLRCNPAGNRRRG